MKKLMSLLLALTMLLCALSGTFSAAAATQTYAEQAIESLQKTSGYIPGGSAVVKGNCYGFISKVCEKLYGKAYQEQLTDNGYTCKHATGLYYEVARRTTGSNVSKGSSDLKALIDFIKSNAMPGDIIHYASLSNSGSRHTIMVQSIDNEKIKVYHSNWNSSSTCQTDIIYWSKLQNADTDGSRNVIFTSKMKYGGLGISINRFTNYNSLFISAGPSVNVVPTVSLTWASSTSVRVAWNPVSGATKYQVNYKLKTDSEYAVAGNNITSNFFEVKDLELGKEYDFRVRAYAGKWMSFSNSKYITVLPPPVSDGVIALADKGVSLSWDKRSDITGVRVYKKAENGDTYSVIKEYPDISGVSYLDTDVKYGNTYYYKLQRYLIKDGRTYGSAGVAFSIKYELKTPSLVFDRISSSEVKISADTDGRQTKLVYYVEADGKKVINDKETDKTSFNLTGLEAGKTYTVYCAEKTSVGRGEWGKLTLQALPKAVENLRVCGLSNGLRIFFDTLSDVSGYYIYRSESANGEFEKIGLVNSRGVNYYNDTKLKINTPYYYKVAGFIKKGNNTYVGDMLDDSLSTAYNVTVPAGLKVVCTSPTSVTVSYKAAIHNQSYTIQYYVQGGRWQTVTGVKELSRTFDKLETGKYYHFRVCAVNSTLGSGNYSAVQSIKVMPPTPKISSVKKVKTGIQVNYSAVKGVSGYAVFRATSKDGTYKKIAVIPSAKTTSYIDKNVTKNKTYYYKVWSYYQKGSEIYRSSKSAAVKLKYK